MSKRISLKYNRQNSGRVKEPVSFVSYERSRRSGKLRSMRNRGESPPMCDSLHGDDSSKDSM